MAWNSVAPDGSKSVKANFAPLGENTTYVEDTMGLTVNDTTNTDVIRDHYWDVDANLDGRHRYINSPGYTIAGLPEDPVLGASMGGTSYFKEKTAAEAPTQQDVKPFYRNAGGIMELQAMRACILVDLVPNGNPLLAPAVTVKYAHNATVDFTTFTEAGSRKFLVNFTTNLPSVDYFVDADCISTQGQAVQNIIMHDTSIAAVKNVAWLELAAYPTTVNTAIPLQIWVSVWGG